MEQRWCSGSLHAEQEVRGSIPSLAATISEIDYLLLPSHDMAEIPLKRRKSSKQPTNQPTNQPNKGLSIMFVDSGTRDISILVAQDFVPLTYSAKVNFPSIHSKEVEHCTVANTGHCLEEGFDEIHVVCECTGTF